MLAKRLMYVCASVFLIVATFHFGATTARGQSGSFKVIGPTTIVVGENVYFIDTGNVPFGWHQLPQGSLDLPPIPASTLASYNSGIAAITDTGEGWAKIDGAWTDIGPAPTLVPVKTVSWGQLKAKYVR